MQRIKAHLRLLTEKIGERSVLQWDLHVKARDAIYENFERLGLQPIFETYDYEGTPVSNVIAEISPGANSLQRFIVGAHYDSVFGTVGADDNASGVAELLELTTVLQQNRVLMQNGPSIRLVAFALEEPPLWMP